MTPTSPKSGIPDEFLLRDDGCFSGSDPERLPFSTKGKQYQKDKMDSFLSSL